VGKDVTVARLPSTTGTFYPDRKIFPSAKEIGRKKKRFGKKWSEKNNESRENKVLETLAARLEVNGTTDTALNRLSPNSPAAGNCQISHGAKVGLGKKQKGRSVHDHNGRLSKRDLP